MWNANANACKVAQNYKIKQKFLSLMCWTNHCPNIQNPIFLLSAAAPSLLPNFCCTSNINSNHFVCLCFSQFFTAQKLFIFPFFLLPLSTTLQQQQQQWVSIWEMSEKFIPASKRKIIISPYFSIVWNGILLKWKKIFLSYRYLYERINYRHTADSSTVVIISSSTVQCCWHFPSFFHLLLCYITSYPPHPSLLLRRQFKQVSFFPSMTMMSQQSFEGF